MCHELNFKNQVSTRSNPRSYKKSCKQISKVLWWSLHLKSDCANVYSEVSQAHVLYCLASSVPPPCQLLLGLDFTSASASATWLNLFNDVLFPSACRYFRDLYARLGMCAEPHREEAGDIFLCPEKPSRTAFKCHGQVLFFCCSYSCPRRVTWR